MDDTVVVKTLTYIIQDETASNERVVTIKRQPGGGLGISVKGGAEHGIPVLISRVFTGQSGMVVLLSNIYGLGLWLYFIRNFF